MVRFALSAFPAFLLSLSVAASPLRLQKRDPVPSFVLENAPVSHLHSAEQWWPSDISVHVSHVVPEVDFKGVASGVTLQNISTLGNDVFLTSKDDVNSKPAWLTSVVGKPNDNGFSNAPTTIVLVNKPNGVLDAFFFYFYSFNDGGKVLGIEFGDHIGDWEHTMVRFVNGVPTNVYLSAHSGGSAFTFDAVEKTNGRPTTYVAIGTHANYPTTGKHCHDLPGDLLCDQTDAGLLWDLAQNYRAFWFDPSTETFSIAGGAGTGAEQIEGEGADWLKFQGMWGDEEYNFLEHGQYCLELGDTIKECRFSSGPTGPIAKNLGRSVVCQKESSCTVATSLATFTAAENDYLITSAVSNLTTSVDDSVSV